MSQSTQTVSCGSNLTVTATPDGCSEFAGWSGDATGTGNAVLTDIQSDKTLTATFNKKTFTVTINSAGDGSGTLSQSTQTVPCGSNLTVTATPDSGSEFTGWTGDATGTGDAVLTNITSDMTITATFTRLCIPPDWAPAQNQQYNMTVMAQLKIGEILSADPDDIIGAFAGTECRGVASPISSDGLIFLTITSDVSSAEAITFKVWDADACKTVNACESIFFENQTEQGSTDEPFIFTDCSKCDMTITFGAGYTWFSVNLDSADTDPNTLFADLNPEKDDRIIGQTGFAVYDGTRWIGSLTAIDPGQMCIMKLSTEQEWSAQGECIDPASTPLHLGAGWTWLGHLPQNALPINTAFENLNPADPAYPTPQYDDRLTGQTKFAVYDGDKWVGSLPELHPGHGYKIRLANAGILTYPDDSKKKRRSSPISENRTPRKTARENDSRPDWTPTPNLLYNMSVITKLRIGDSFSTDEADMIGAFVGDECRGIASPISSYDGYVFLTVGSDVPSGETVTFKAYIADSDAVYDMPNQEMTFEDQGEVGTLEAPVTIGAVTAEIASSVPDITDDSPISVTVTFSTSVTGFEVSDIVTNGTIDDFEGSGTEYSFTLTPSNLGLVTVDIPANVVADTDSIGNTTATQFRRTCISLRAAMLVLKALAGMDGDDVTLELDVTKDGKLGTEDAVYILNFIAD